MGFLYSRVPTNNPELHNQKELSDISEEEFEDEWKERKFKWYHIVFQIFCFLICLGPLRVVVGLVGFVILVTFVAVFRKIQIHVLKIDRKYCKKFLYNVLQISVRFICIAFGHLRVIVKGKVDPETRIVISNHTAFHDPFLINLVLPVSAVCKKELGDTIFGYMLDVIDPIYVQRDHAGGQTKLIIERANNVDTHPVLVFPEATLTNGDITLKFHRGAFLTDKKVQPMVITYHMPFVPKGWNTFAWTTNNTFLYFWQCVSMPLNWVTINILPPMTVNDFDGTPDTFAAQAELAVANFLGTKATTRSSNEIFMKKKQNKEKTQPNVDKKKTE